MHCIARRGHFTLLCIALQVGRVALLWGLLCGRVSVALRAALHRVCIAYGFCFALQRGSHCTGFALLRGALLCIARGLHCIAQGFCLALRWGLRGFAVALHGVLRCRRRGCRAARGALQGAAGCKRRSGVALHHCLLCFALQCAAMGRHVSGAGLRKGAGLKKGAGL